MDNITLTTETPPVQERPSYSDSTYELVSKVAYLIGVPKRIFENEHEPPQMEIYEALEKDKSARIIRNLCTVRAIIERSYKHINRTMTTEYKSIYSIPEHIPTESLNQLIADGITLNQKAGTPLTQYIIELNRLISDRINNCKGIFPLWVKWEYIKDLFIMPNGMTETGVRNAAAVYYNNIGCYPYKIYINWQPAEEGNILRNDKKFVNLLYKWHNDYFAENSKVSDVGSHIKNSIYDYIADSGKVVIIVDCENSDPYKLAATLANLDPGQMDKIASIILYDDIHAASGWEILEQYTSIPVDYVMIERLKQQKSLADVKITARTCQEHYVNNVDSFIIVSSDSDYWGLITALPTARFLVMVEREKCGQDIKEALINSGIFFCYIDDFFSGNADEIKYDAIIREMKYYIEEMVRLNVNEMYEAALQTTRIKMSSSEKGQFFEKYIRTMKMVIADNGDVKIEFKRK